MTKLAIKLFGYNNAQTILTRSDNGTHWYMASDICNLLGKKGYSAAVHKLFKKNSAYTLADKEWDHRTEYTGTSKRRLLLVSDVGMLKLVMQSDSTTNAEAQKVASALLATIK